MAVWWLFVLEFHFSAGGYQVQRRSVPKAFLVALFVQLLVAVLMAVRFQLLCILLLRTATNEFVIVD
jgi:hypothetical protein